MSQDTTLLARARDMRKAPTPLEVKLWKCLSASQLGGFKFRRQHVIGSGVIADFFCPDKGLIVELDRDTHDPLNDAKRDAAMAKLRYTTLRFTNGEVTSNIDGVLEAILLKLYSLPALWPHPNLSPEGGLSTP